MFTVAQELNMKQHKRLLTDDYTGKTQMFIQWLIIYLTTEDNFAVCSTQTSPREITLNQVNQPQLTCNRAIRTIEQNSDCWQLGVGKGRV